MDAPVVIVDNDGHLTLEYPAGRPHTVPISIELLEQVVADLNEVRPVRWQWGYRQDGLEYWSDLWLRGEHDCRTYVTIARANGIDIALLKRRIGPAVEIPQ